MTKISLSEFWNEGCTGCERFGIIMVIIGVIIAFVIPDEHKILKRVLGVIWLLLFASGIYSYGGGGERGRLTLGAVIVAGSIIGFFMDWMQDDIEGIGGIVPYAIAFIIGILVSGIITL